MSRLRLFPAPFHPLLRLSPVPFPSGSRPYRVIMEGRCSARPPKKPLGFPLSRTLPIQRRVRDKLIEQ